MSSVALFLHPERPEAKDLASELAVWLAERHIEVRLPAPDAARAGLDQFGVDEDRLCDGLDLAVSLGGDGTMLWTVEMVAPHGVPVLGVNLGQLGYLTEVEPEASLTALAGFLDGEHRIEERLLLEVELVGPDHDSSLRRWAMNEIVVEKAPLGQIVRLGVAFDSRHFTSYAADGLIVATPTGSTAYSLSARGPIVEPTHRAVLLTPVAPHMLFDRTLVLEPETVVDIEVLDRPAIVSVDGRSVAEVRAGDLVRCRTAARPARLVSFGERDFHEILVTKFGLRGRAG